MNYCTDADNLPDDFSELALYEPLIDVYDPSL